MCDADPPTTGPYDMAKNNKDRHASHRVLGAMAAGQDQDEAIETLRDNVMIVIDDVAGSRHLSGEGAAGCTA